MSAMRTGKKMLRSVRYFWFSKGTSAKYAAVVRPRLWSWNWGALEQSRSAPESRDGTWQRRERRWFSWSRQEMRIQAHRRGNWDAMCGGIMKYWSTPLKEVGMKTPSSNLRKKNTSYIAQKATHPQALEAVDRQLGHSAVTSLHYQGKVQRWNIPWFGHQNSTMPINNRLETISQPWRMSQRRIWTWNRELKEQPPVPMTFPWFLAKTRIWRVIFPESQVRRRAAGWV